MSNRSKADVDLEMWRIEVQRLRERVAVLENSIDRHEKMLIEILEWEKRHEQVD